MLSSSRATIYNVLLANLSVSMFSGEGLRPAFGFARIIQDLIVTTVPSDFFESRIPNRYQC